MRIINTILILVAGVVGAILMAGAAVGPQRTRLQFEVRCPECGVKQIRTSKAVHLNGSYSTVVRGVDGFMQKRTASFHCDSCRSEFDSPIQPDKFVPLLPATPVEIATEVRTKQSELMIGPMVLQTNVIPRIIQLSDGTTMELVQRVTPSTNGPEVIIYHRK
jgi:hypothetical protein